MARRKDRDKDKNKQQQPAAPQTSRSLPQPRQHNNPALAGLTVRQMPQQGSADLAGRIREQPAGSVQAVGGGASPGGAPQVMPLAQVITAPVSSDYSTIAYRGLTPLWTADGAAVPAVSPGRWAQLISAGRP